ncbi:MAG: V-type ATP synthase subunit C [Firmicutes bacterium]|nr:V-type ATP synthase subunit C [Bacillota bacterium]
MLNNDRYAYAVGRVRAMESRLLDSGKIERMVEAKSAEEALKILSESEYAGYLSESTSAFAYEKILEAELRRVYLELRKFVPNPEIINLFASKFDYHNVKVLLKAKQLEENRDDLLVQEIGNLSLSELVRAVGEGDFKNLPPRMREATESITEQFRVDVNPQIVDLLLDRAMYADIFSTLQELKSPFMTGYFIRLVDLINIKTFLRVQRLGRSKEFLESALLPAGDINIIKLVQLGEPMEIVIDRLSFGRYSKVVEEGILAYQKTDTMTRYEKLLDDFLIQYIKLAKYSTFGPEPIVGYLLAKENELKTIRIVMVGKINQLPVEEIRERLRDVYV